MYLCITITCIIHFPNINPIPGVFQNLINKSDHSYLMQLSVIGQLGALVQFTDMNEPFTNIKILAKMRTSLYSKACHSQKWSSTMSLACCQSPTGACTSHGYVHEENSTCLHHPCCSIHKSWCTIFFQWYFQWILPKYLCIIRVQMQHNIKTLLWFPHNNSKYCAYFISRSSQPFPKDYLLNSRMEP